MKNLHLFKRLLIALVLLISFQGFSQEKLGGLALYTVRNDMNENAKATLKAVADAGYVNVEAAGYNKGKFYDMAPVDFKNYLLSVGLTPISSHQGGANNENIDEMIAAVKAAGFKYFVIPVPPMGHFKVDKNGMGMSNELELLTDFFNAVGKKCNAAGLQLLYHNHDFEFKKNENGIVPIEYFLENTDPKFVNFQMDLYWVTKAGASPVEYFEKYPGRFKIWHVKDMDKEGRFAPVGTGTIDFSKILAKKDLSGMLYYMVEQDKTYDNMKPLEVIKTSHKGLEKIGFK